MLLVVAHEVRGHAIDVMRRVEGLCGGVDVVDGVVTLRKMRDVDWIVSNAGQRFMGGDQIKGTQILNTDL